MRGVSFEEIEFIATATRLSTNGRKWKIQSRVSDNESLTQFFSEKEEPMKHHGGFCS